MATVDLDDSSLTANSQPKSVYLAWVLAVVCITHMNQVNSCNIVTPRRHHHKYQSAIIIIINTMANTIQGGTAYLSLSKLWSYQLWLKLGLLYYKVVMPSVQEVQSVQVWAGLFKVYRKQFLNEITFVTGHWNAIKHL